MSGRTMDVEKHWLQLTSSPAYNSFLETTENCTLQIQRKHQILFVYHVLESPRVPESPSPRVPRLRVPRLRVTRLRVPRLRVPRLRVPSPRVPRLRVPRLRVPRLRVPRPTFSHSRTFTR